MQNTSSAEGSLWESFTFPAGMHPDPGRDLIFLEKHSSPEQIEQARERTILALRGMGAAINSEGEEGLQISFHRSQNQALATDTLSDLSALNRAQRLQKVGIQNLTSYLKNLKLYYEVLMEKGEYEKAFLLISVNVPRDIMQVASSDERQGVLREEHQTLMKELLEFCEKETERPEHHESMAVARAAMQAHFARISEHSQYQSLQ